MDKSVHFLLPSGCISGTVNPSLCFSPLCCCRPCPCCLSVVSTCRFSPPGHLWLVAMAFKTFPCNEIPFHLFKKLEKSSSLCDRYLNPPTLSNPQTVHQTKKCNRYLRPTNGRPGRESYDGPVVQTRNLAKPTNSVQFRDHSTPVYDCVYMCVQNKAQVNEIQPQGNPRFNCCKFSIRP